ncbi:hypothetical protein [Saccharopolyspora mangrovi]|uniref:Uncharacterized protein n=1 Tax=Saccharopolyspora mangrovi TaxID=3082379 RepID=A0ABU6A7Q7_9PSEU|nr:hypothetical protein [Saccharopolyspora sp. S2-29]MEB3367424.1 hypothetical protein [Saccharopolyspora sp. S2-29]
MAITLDEYSPFDAGPGSNVTEGQWRKFMRNVLSGGDGVLRGLKDEFHVYADSTGMQVKVKTGECWIQGAWGHNASEKILPIATAPGTNSRKDRVILRNDFVNNRIELDVLTGTAAASPVAPTMTRNSSMHETSLAVVTVGTSVVTIAAGNVTIGAERERSSPYARYRRASGLQTIATSTATNVQFPTPVFEDYAVTASGTNNSVFTLNRAGIWHVDVSISWNTEAANFGGIRKVSISDGVNPLIAYEAQACPGPTAAQGAAVINSCAIQREWPAGQQLVIRAIQLSPGSKDIEGSDSNATPTKVCFAWMGY